MRRVRGTFLGSILVGLFVVNIRPARAHHEGALAMKIVIIYPLDVCVGTLGLVAPVLASRDTARGGSRARWAVAGLYLSAALNAGVAALWIWGEKPGAEQTAFTVAHFAVAALDLGFAIWETTRLGRDLGVRLAPTVIRGTVPESPAFGPGVSATF